MFKPTQEHANADGLSRLPVATSSSEESVGLEGVSVFNIGQVQSLPVTATQLQNSTRQDPTLSHVLKCPVGTRNVPDELKPYWIRRSELTVEQGCVMWGIRVVIPIKLQSRVLAELHDSHSGMVKT